MDYPPPVARLIDELKKLPGIGPKSAQRIAFHLLRSPREDAVRLGTAVGGLLDGIRTCSLCNAITDREVCATCSDPARTDRIVCVVEEPHDLLSVEKTRDFRGRYHVLHGALSPLQGVGPDELKIEGLLERIRKGGVEEVILATSPTVEGEATAVYLVRILKPLGVRVTRIAMGVPVGSDLEWADEVTMAKALEGRREY
ncbi:MAG TPA: recombination mediator RecR [Vicinamibacteria bacterium]|nr:recombination mediator RecR [Vicinamibacteria bacterium]